MICANRKGDVSQLKAVAWLIESGHEVFVNISKTGPVDIIAIDADGNALLFDVKTRGSGGVGVSNPGGRTLTPWQRELGVRRLWVSPEGKCRIQNEGSNQLNLPTVGNDDSVGDS